MGLGLNVSVAPVRVLDSSKYLRLIGGDEVIYVDWRRNSRRRGSL